MPRSALILTAALVAGAAFLALCIQRVERSEPQFAAASTKPPEIETGASELRAPPLVEPEDVAVEVEQAGEIEEADEPSSSRRVAASDDAVRISGRVVVAGGLPSEEVFVTARVYRGTFWVGEWSHARARVGADGAFTLRLPEEVVHAELDVESPALELAKPAFARPGETQDVHAPALLARVSVWVVPPPGVPASAVAWQGVRAALSRQRDLESLFVTEITERPTRPPSEAIPAATPSGDGGFEFTGVPIGVALDLDVDHPYGPSWTRQLEPLAEGQRLVIVAELDTGIAMSGRVVDETGKPVMSANVSVRVPRPSGERVFVLAGDSTTTDLSGSFRFEALQRTDWLVVAQRQGFSRSDEQLVTSRGGDVHGLVLRMVRDGAIVGTVTWADGRPAGWTSVSAWHERRMKSGTIASDGTFRLSLPDGVYDVQAEAKGPGFLGKARVEGVATGGATLALVLERSPTFELRGLVVDSADAPVERFTVRWRSLDGAHIGNRADGKGSFVLDLPAGEFAIEVQAERCASLEQNVAVAGPRSEPVRFVLQPAGLVRGQVVDARGAPVADAQVLVGGRRAVSSRADGRFELLPPSELVSLRATSPGHLASEPVEVRVAS